MTSVLLRTLLMYLFIYLMIRLMGKREIGKLSVFDMVISIMIAEIAVISIEDTDRPVWSAAAPIALLAAVQLAVAQLSLRNRRIRLWFDGRPSVLIHNGELNWREMRRLRYNLDDLLTQLRENQLDDVGAVEWAVLEPNGKLSVLPKRREEQEPPASPDGRAAHGERAAHGGPAAHGERAAHGGPAAHGEPAAHGQLAAHGGPAAPASGEAASSPSPQSGSSPAPASAADAPTPAGASAAEPAPKFRFALLPIPLIMDGAVQDQNLEQIGKNRFWLKNELGARGIRHFSQVFLCTMDHRGKLYVSRKR